MGRSSEAHAPRPCPAQRADIDAEIRAATYPGHAPARWALPLLDELEVEATGWQLVELDEAELAALWLPAHAGEACHGDTMRLGEGDQGATVRAAHAWLAVHAEAYAAANPSCWGRITRASRGPAPPSSCLRSRWAIASSPTTQRWSSSTASIGRSGYWMAGHRTCQAYVPVICAVD